MELSKARAAARRFKRIGKNKANNPSRSGQPDYSAEQFKRQLTL